jgi:hypothetical protein
MRAVLRLLGASLLAGLVGAAVGALNPEIPNGVAGAFLAFSLAALLSGIAIWTIVRTTPRAAPKPERAYSEEHAWYSKDA